VLRLNANRENCNFCPCIYVKFAVPSDSFELLIDNIPIQRYIVYTLQDLNAM
jgi:hypothetical protein